MKKRAKTKIPRSICFLVIQILLCQNERQNSGRKTIPNAISKWNIAPSMHATKTVSNMDIFFFCFHSQQVRKRTGNTMIYGDHADWVVVMNPVDMAKRMASHAPT